MKNKIILIVAAMAMATSLIGSDSEIIKRIEKIGIVKSIEGKVDKLIDQGSLYQISVTSKKDGMMAEAFLTKDLSTIIFGEAFDTKSGEQLTVPIDMNPDKVIKAESYVYGKGENEYFLFTDPECPYCIDLEKKMHLLNDNIRMHVVLFPLSFHKNAKAMSYYIMSQKTNALKVKAMSDIANGSLSYKNAKYSADELKKLNKKLEDGLNVARTLRVSGTPTLLDVNGQKVDFQGLMSK